MLNDSIFNPDGPRWITAPGHNAVVSRLLRRAFAHIADGPRRPLAYADAFSRAAECVEQPRSRHQNMLVSLALGLALEGMGYGDHAIDAYYDALESARESGDILVAIELHELLGDTLRCRGRNSEAADFYQEGLQTLEEMGGAVPLTGPTALRFRLGLAVARAATGIYAEAWPHLHITRELARQAGDTVLGGGIDLTMANIHTAQGDAHAALPCYLAARDAYLALGDNTTPSRRRMQGRIHALAAGGLLDVAEVYARRGHDVRRFVYVEMAGNFVQQALSSITRAEDPGGCFLALIARARLERLSGRLTSGIHLLTPLLTDAEQAGDHLVAIQVHTAIGRDYAARGDPEHARLHYQQAYQSASMHHADLEGSYAQRELLRGLPD